MGNSQSSADIKSYTCELPDTKKTGFTSVHRHSKAKENLYKRYDENVKTLYDNWKIGAKKNPSANCLGTRFQPDGSVGPYIWQSYEQVDSKIHKFGSGLRNIGLQKGSIVGIYSLNRPEYAIAEQACYSQSMIFVSLYDTLGPDAVTYIINHCGMNTIVSTQDKIKGLLSVAKNCPTLKFIIQVEAIGDKDIQKAAQSAGVTLNSFDEISSNGAFKLQEAVPPSPDDIASIMYTSGTTGLPKGVVIKHSNAIAASAAAFEMGMGLVATDIHLSYLPMAHIFERGIQVLCFAAGASVGFYQGAVPKLFDDIQELRPTIFASVPRLFNRLYDKVLQTVNETGGMKKTLFTKAFNSKRQQLENGKLPNSPMWDKLVFENLRKKLGGRVRLIITGSAPISNEVYAFLKICFCCPVVQGYGLTETCAAGSVTLSGDSTVGNVGVPVPCCEIRLASVPEMKYLAEEGKGEICIRGPNVFSEYYKDPEKTKEAFDSEGFFLTGDIGKWNENGSLTIIDRKKNIFKLAQGEYVAIEYIESVYVKNRFVQQMFAYGDSYQWCLVAIVVPDFEVLIPWAKENGLPEPENPKSLCNNDKVKAKILADIADTAKEQKLQGFELVKSIYLEAEPFSVENGLLTPSFKSMRTSLKERYKSNIDSLYSSIPKPI